MPRHRLRRNSTASLSKCLGPVTTPDQCGLKCRCRPLSQYQYGVISACWAPLTTSYAAGVSSITVGALNGFNGIAAQYVIPPNYQMTLGFGTANAETVIVRSVQTVSAGYTSVQLTLASPTIVSHAANDLICDIEPGGISLPPAGTYPKCFDAASITGSVDIGFSRRSCPCPPQRGSNPSALRSASSFSAVDAAISNSEDSSTTKGTRVPFGYVPSSMRPAITAATCRQTGRVRSSSMQLTLDVRGALCDRGIPQ